MLINVERLHFKVLHHVLEVNYMLQIPAMHMCTSTHNSNCKYIRKRYQGFVFVLRNVLCSNKFELAKHIILLHNWIQKNICMYVGMVYIYTYVHICVH